MKKVFLEKREHNRNILQSVIGVTFSLHGLDQEFSGIINDKCPQGIGISTSEIIPPETMLDITLSEQPSGGHSFSTEKFLGEVRWCSPSEWFGDTFLLGINFQDLKKLQ